jgi:glycosyltransferase involved in cell wall biosynthesis
VVTRHWGENETDYTAISAEKEIRKEEHGHYTVWRLPYKGSFRDRLVKRYGPRAIPLGKFFSFFQVIGQNYFLRSIPYRNIYDFSRKLLKENPDIKLVLTSGRPFVHFKFAHLLKKEFPHIEWVADYRDAWTTSTIKDDQHWFLYRLIDWLESKSEKRWLKNASIATASSIPIADGVASYTAVPAYPLYNGFVSEDFEAIPSIKPFERFTICYIGTLYKGQKIEIFCDAYKQFLDNHPDSKTELRFIGLANDQEQAVRVRRLLAGYEYAFIITERIERKKTLEVEKKAHLLLHVAWKGYSGIVASKIYEYIASGTQILVTPSDQDIIESILLKSECGLITNSASDTLSVLEELYDNYLKGKTIRNDISKPQVQQFSRLNQVEVLANLLDKL